jgi:hypothetical protein
LSCKEYKGKSFAEARDFLLPLFSFVEVLIFLWGQGGPQVAVSLKDWSVKLGHSEAEGRRISKNDKKGVMTQPLSLYTPEQKSPPKG